MILGVDLASYQGAPDFAQVKKAGYDFGITKVSEGDTYTFPGFRRNRAEMHRVDMGVGFYHFARGGSFVKESDYFLGAIGPMAPGECLALDWEIAHPDPVEWCHGFLCRVYARVGVRPMLYLNRDTATKRAWNDVAGAGFPLWLAQYDGLREFPGVPYWGTPVIKQFSDHGTVSGIAGNVDLNCLNGDLGLFRRLGANPATVTAPATGPDTLPTLQYGDTGSKVESLQRFLNAYPWKPALPLLPVTGNYRDQTATVLAGAQKQMNIDGGDGRNIGPQTRHGLWDRGWRG